jgi:ABC-type sugar transport system ATPase subunit
MSGALDGTKLRLDRVRKVFALASGETTEAIADFSLEIRQGEFLVIVGPSGCG